MSTMIERMSSFPTIDTLNEMGLDTTAKKIRYLRSLQQTEDRGSIAKHLGIKYQWVRNVLLQQPKKIENPIVEMTEEHLYGPQED